MNIKDANKFIETISYPYKEPVFEFRSLSAKGSKPMHLGNSKNLDVKTLIELCSEKEYNMYMCINPLIDTKTRYAKDGDVKGFKWVYIDGDSPESVRNLFEHPLHKKAFITCTGTKPDARYHAYWLIQDDLNADQWKSVQKMLIDIFKNIKPTIVYLTPYLWWSLKHQMDNDLKLWSSYTLVSLFILGIKYLNLRYYQIDLVHPIFKNFINLFHYGIFLISKFYLRYYGLDKCRLFFNILDYVFRK